MYALRLRRLAPLALLATLLAAPAAAGAAPARWEAPKLLGRAILPATAYQPGPVSGTALGTAPINGVTPPFPGQPVPGFSAVLDVGDGTFWAMPDNGFGAQGNSADFLLRIYRVRPDFPVGGIEILETISLRDPDHRIRAPFQLTRTDRLLTGADFDIESVRRTRNGDFWFGEEFGPFLLHTDSTGKVLEAPFQPPAGVQAPQNPYRTGPETLQSSRGFEGMALGANGRTLYPIVEGPLIADRDGGAPYRRLIFEFNTRRGEYTGRTWHYRTDTPAPGVAPYVIGDFTALDEHRFIAIERDDFQGTDPQLAQKKLYLVDLRRTDAEGYLRKTLVADLLHIEDRLGISTPARSGEFRVGRSFAFPLQSVESVEVLGGNRLLVANDNNFPFSNGRWTARDRPDDTEMIVIRVPGLRDLRVR
jgi:hypothetical protein